MIFFIGFSCRRLPYQNHQLNPADYSLGPIKGTCCIYSKKTIIDSDWSANARWMLLQMLHCLITAFCEQGYSAEGSLQPSEYAYRHLESVLRTTDALYARVNIGAYK